MSDIVPAVTRINTNMNVPTPQALPGTAPNNGLLGQAAWNLLLALQGSTPQGADNWRALGYPSREAYEQAMKDYENRTGRSATTGQPIEPQGSPNTDRMTTNSDGSRVSSDGQTVYSADGSRYTTNGVTYDTATGQAINPATNEISPGGYSIDPKTGARTDRPAAPAPAGPRPATVSLPLLDLDGINSHLDTILSKGKDWEYTGNTQLADINTFLPGEIPTTGDNDGNQGATNTETVVEGATATPAQPATDPDEGDAPRSVTVPGAEAPTNWAERQSNASRRAFLDHPGGSLAALRAAHAERGIYSQGGKYFTNIGGKATEVSKEDYDSYRLGNITAQEFKDRYTQEVIDTLEPAGDGPGVTVEAEVPPEQEESQGLPTTEQVTPGSQGASVSVGDDEDEDK